MAIEVPKILVSSGSSSSVSSFQHRDFPEIRVEAENSVDAARLLVSQFKRALDSALTDWRRQSLEQAIIDVNSFAHEHQPDPSAVR